MVCASLLLTRVWLGGAGESIGKGREGGRKEGRKELSTDERKSGMLDDAGYSPPVV